MERRKNDLAQLRYSSRHRLQARLRSRRYRLRKKKRIQYLKLEASKVPKLEQKVKNLKDKLNDLSKDKARKDAKEKKSIMKFLL